MSHINPKTFTADDGSKWEAQGMQNKTLDYLLIYPLPEASKLEWEVEGPFENSTISDFRYYLPIRFTATKPQAEAIREAVEWLMRTIVNDGDYADHLDGRSSLNEAVVKTHKALQRSK